LALKAERRRAVEVSRVVPFATQADDQERAVSFYASVFGWEIKKLAGVEFD